MQLYRRTVHYLLPEERFSEMDALQSQRIRLCLVAALILIPLALIGVLLLLTIPDYQSASAGSTIIVLALAVWVLLHYGHYLLPRVLLSFVPPFLVALLMLSGSLSRMDLYLGLPFLFIGLSMLPVILLDYRREQALFWIAIGLHLLFIMSMDRVVYWGVEVSPHEAAILDHYVFSKVSQLLLAIGVAAGLLVFLDSTRRTHEKLVDANQALVAGNDQIQSINEKVNAQNRELNEKQSYIQEQFQRIQNYYNELLATKKELLKNIDQLRVANAVISSKESEASSMLNVLKQLFLVIELDVEGRVNWINDDFGDKSIDWGDGPIVGKKISTVLQLEKDGPEKDSRLTYLHTHWPDVLAGKSFDFDSNLRSANGGLRRYHFVLAPILETNAAAGRILAVGQDLTGLVEQKDRIERINRELNQKVNEIEQKNILLNFQQNEIFEKNETLRKQKEEIQTINDSLEERVRERTIVLEKKNKQLAEYAYINSHILRAPLSSMMGLIGLLKYQDLKDDDRRLYELLQETARHLDDIVNKINNAVDTGFHFDRSYLDKKTSIIDRKGDGQT